MTNVSIFTTLLLAFITVIKADDPVDPCLPFKGLEFEKGCSNQIEDVVLPAIPDGASEEEIKSAYAAICVVSDCMQKYYIQGSYTSYISDTLANVLDIVPGNKCKDVPVISNPPDGCSASSLQLVNRLVKGINEAKNAAIVTCTAGKCLEKNGLTPPSITNPSGALSCIDNFASCASKSGILDHVLSGLVCHVQACTLNILRGVTD